MSSKTQPEPAVAATLGLGRGAAKRWRWKRWSVAALVAAAAIAAAVAWKNSGTSTSVRYEASEVGRGDLVVTVTATGNLEPTNQVDVGSEVSGTIEFVRVDYNDRVQVGQVLASLDTTKLKAMVLQSQARLEAARSRVLTALADIRQARHDLARLQQVQDLSGGTVPSQRDLDAAAAVLERALAEETGAHAEVSEAQATLEANQSDLSKAVIRSPVNGIVLVRTAEPGQTVAATFQAPVLFTLAEDLAKMDLHVDVDEADVGQVKEGQEAAFTVDAYADRVFPARVAQVRYGSQILEGVVTYETLLAVDNADLWLRPGMTATAEIVVGKVKDAILVPNGALRFTPPLPEAPAPAEKRGVLGMLLPHPRRSGSASKQGGEAAPQGRQQRVWVLRQGNPVAVPVTAGATDGTRTEITGGELEPGMRLAIGVLTAGP